MRALEIGVEEWGDVRACLGDDEVVDVEELGDAGEGGFAVVVGGLAPGAEGDFLCGCPGHDGAGFVFALQDYGGVEGGGGCVGG